MNCWQVPSSASGGRNSTTTQLVADLPKLSESFGNDLLDHRRQFDGSCDCLRLVSFGPFPSGRANYDSSSFRRGERFLRTLGDLPGLLLGEGRLDVEHEAVFGWLFHGDKIYARLQKPGNEVDVPSQAIELRNN